METRQPTTEVVALLERQIQSRIEILAPIIDKLLKNKLLLRKHQHSQVSILIQKELAARSSKESKIERNKSPIVEDEVVNGFDTLDGILSLAKEIRLTANKSGKSGKLAQEETLKDKHTKISGRQSLRDALLVPKHAEKDVNLNDEAVLLPSPEETFVNDLHEQLLYLSRNRIALSSSKLYVNRTKYCEEGKFLTKLLSRSDQPLSALFQSIFPCLPLMNVSEREVAHFTSPLSAADSIVMRLAQQFRNLIVSYERYMKVRVSHESFKVTQLTTEDKKSLIAMWMRGRKLLDLYKHYEKSKQRLSCSCESCKLSRAKHAVSSVSAISTVDRVTPYFTPLSCPNARIDTDSSVAMFMNKSTSKSKQGGTLDNSSAWAKASKSRLEAFHQAYQSKILLLTESAVGQEQLKVTIQSLKACCEDSSNRAKLDQSALGVFGSSDVTFVSRWTESLKQFRLVYSILLNEAQELNHCMFINKA